MSELMLSVVAGAVGLGLFIYGKKQHRLPQLLGGIGLMLFPYFVSGAGWMMAVAGGIIVCVAAAVRAGY